MQVTFYPGRYAIEKGSILPVGDPTQYISSAEVRTSLPGASAKPLAMPRPPDLCRVAGGRRAQHHLQHAGPCACGRAQGGLDGPVSAGAAPPSMPGGLLICVRRMHARPARVRGWVGYRAGGRAIYLQLAYLLGKLLNGNC